MSDRLFIPFQVLIPLITCMVLLINGCSERHYQEYITSDQNIDSIFSLLYQDTALSARLSQQYEAYKLFDSLNKAKSRKDESSELKYTISLANLFRESGLYQAGIRYYGNARALITDSAVGYKTELLHGLSAIYYELYIHNPASVSYLDSASALADSAWQIADLHSIIGPKADIQNIRGAVQFQRGNYKQARLLLEQSLQQHLKNGNDTTLAVFINLAYACYKLGDQTNALKFANQALLNAVRQKNSVFEYTALEITGMIYHAMGDSLATERINKELLLIKSRRDVIIKSLLTNQKLGEYEKTLDKKLIFGLLQEKFYFFRLSRILTSGVILLTFILLVIGLVFRANYRLSKTRHELNLLQQQASELELKNARLILQATQTESDRLKEELELKHHAFAAKLITIAQIKEFLNKLRDDITRARNEKSGPDILQTLDGIETEINKNIQTFLKEEFEEIYASGNNKLVNQLTNLHPDLTINEKRLCFLISRNFSTKEIAGILLKTYRSVEMARHRLRIKLRLDKDVTLEAYLNNLS